MNAEIAGRLIALNRRFYQSFGLSFAATRERLQPGVVRVLETLPAGARVLDLGCGHGGVAWALAGQRHQGGYVGLDFSAELLNLARTRTPESLNAAFHQADLAEPGWEASLEGPPFDFILAFAVLHHLPGERLRRQVIRRARAFLKEDGRLVHSVWQFLHSPRLKSRIQPWERVGLKSEQVDPGDYLLDWRRDGLGLRYVHHFTLQELTSLAAAAGFRVLDTFESDGEGGRLGLYQVWGKQPDPSEHPAP